MEHGFILITEKIESKKCKSHNEIAAIKMVDGKISAVLTVNTMSKLLLKKKESYN